MSQSTAAKEIVERIQRCGSPQEINGVWTEWRNAHPRPPDLSGIRFANIVFPNGINFSQLNFTNAHFENCTAESPNFQQTDLSGATFSHCRISGGSMHSITARAASFVDCSLSYSELQMADLRGALFEKCDLRVTSFNESELTDASIVNSAVNSGTVFKNLKACRGLRIDRFSLACLGDSRGSLTEGNLMEMTVVDDVARLRQQFGGVWSLFHLASLVVFAFPYVWFLIRQWSVARFVSPHVEGGTMALWEALWRFIRTGGVDWKTSPGINWFPFSMFVLILAYNVVRGTLLWKTKKLETEQQVKGLPALFSMEQSVSFCRIQGRWWHWLYQASRYGFWLYLALVAVNAWHFLTMRIPV